MDLVKPKQPVMDSQRQRAELEKNLLVAQENSRVGPGNQRFQI